MDTLYHYTSLDGLLGIVRDQCLWATHARYLNDDSELQHALDLIERMASNIADNEEPKSSQGEILAAMLKPRHSPTCYIVSFSAHGDQLSQWRGYCPVGAGVSLGFVGDELFHIGDLEGWRLRGCCYETDQKRRLVTEALKSEIAAFAELGINARELSNLVLADDYSPSPAFQKALREAFDSDDKANALASIFLAFIEQTVFFKNWAFREESEWRLAYIGNSEAVNFRAQRSFLAPYTKLHLQADGLKKTLSEVIIGPNPNQQRCAESVRNFLEAHELGHVEVKQSAAPFNAW